MALYVDNPNGELSLPVGEVHLKYTDGSYLCIMLTDEFDVNEAMLVDKFIKDHKIEDAQNAIFVDPIRDIYWDVYPIFCPYRHDYSYIKDEVRKQKGRCN